jgi:hypothetical protein
MMKILLQQAGLGKLMDRGFRLLLSDLSTSVEDLLWISVYIIPIKALRLFLVDIWCINHRAYTQVIHRNSEPLKLCKNETQKKKLDRLSTYPQSLLLLLNYKISYIG